MSHYKWTRYCIQPHSVMRKVLDKGQRYRFSSDVIYTVIEITEYDNPYGYFTINSRFYHPTFNLWIETKSNSGQLQPHYEEGHLISLEETIKPMEYMRPHIMIKQ